MQWSPMHMENITPPTSNQFSSALTALTLKLDVAPPVIVPISKSMPKNRGGNAHKLQPVAESAVVTVKEVVPMEAVATEKAAVLMEESVVATEKAEVMTEKQKGRTVASEKEAVLMKEPVVEAEKPEVTTKKATGITQTEAVAINREGVEPEKITETPGVTTTKAEEKKSLFPRNRKPLFTKFHPAGVKYEVLRLGTSKFTTAKFIERGEAVKLRYEARVAKTGEEFDSGTMEFTYGFGDAMWGLEDGIINAMIGEERRIYIPAKLTTNRDGIRPPKVPTADIIFDVEFLN